VTFNIVHSIFYPNFQKNLSHLLFDSLIKQDAAFFDEKLSGVLLSRVESDVDHASSAITDELMVFIEAFTQITSGLVIMFSSSWKVALIMLTCLSLFGINQICSNKFLDSLVIQYDQKKELAAAKAKEILSSIRTVKSFDSEMIEYHNFKAKLDHVHKINIKAAIAMGISEFFSTSIHWGLYSIVLFFTGRQVLNNEIESGDIIVFVTILNNWKSAFSQLFGNITEFKKANVSIAKILAIINRKPAINLAEGMTVSHVRGRIEFKDVKFKYPSRSDYTLNGVSFIIETGETVALVGQSGCGKSTTLMLIQRFYDINEGEILIDGRNITKIQPLSLRSHIAFVHQHLLCFQFQ
jgi:ABC-type multidrug transport system fused ATPase/permease subunit